MKLNIRPLSPVFIDFGDAKGPMGEEDDIGAYVCMVDDGVGKMILRENNVNDINIPMDLLVVVVLTYITVAVAINHRSL
jgi:hypothetical protein